jgi:hypothetical protein
MIKQNKVVNWMSFIANLDEFRLLREVEEYKEEV